MVKSELVQKLCDLHPNIIRKDMEKVVDTIILEIFESLAKDETVEIRGWGRFKTAIRKARIGRNPKTLEKKIVSERNVVLFKPSKDLKFYINKDDRK